MACKSIRIVHRASLAAVSALLLAVAPAVADSLDDSDENAQSSFSRFAETWMARMRTTEAENRKNPTVQPGPSNNLVTYRGIGDDFSVELRPTGHPAAPFIGILRYSERIYSCRELSSANCSIASTVPVTEIFRFSGGSWIY